MTTTHTRRILAVATAAAALLLLAGPASASSAVGGMTKPEYRALMLRSHALNATYGLGVTPAEHRALELRGEALNKQYHLGAFATTGSGRFARSSVVIVVFAAIGLVLLTAGAVAGGRRRGALRARSS